MTRFQQEISGALGSFWKESAEKELDELRRDLANGKITIDENGIARNCIGRVLMDDQLERLAYITNKVNVEATHAAHEAEVARELEEYRRNKKPATAEEIAEMRAAFGPGAKVTDILTGETITLD